MTLNTMIQNRYGECFMNDKMKEEILDSWNSWKYDIKDMNRSEWTQRDESILDAIDIALRKEFGSDRKTND